MDCVLIDTSSIIFSVQNKNDIFESINLRFPLYVQMVSEAVVSELKKISSGNSSKSRAAKVGLRMIKIKKIKVDTKVGYADLWMLENAKKDDRNIFVTNDIALFRALKSLHKRSFKISKQGILRN